MDLRPADSATERLVALMLWYEWQCHPRFEPKWPLMASTLANARRIGSGQTRREVPLQEQAQATALLATARLVYLESE